ncbi:malto-oligosyltrehalose trehalohydrolase [Acidipropionibacterium thoenii]|uniref:malto-oligosyltrehalose trehalohydrolase n=1 Tax=Acidipropionibacterium thoenii TaxID=1751 RepID=UPI0003F904D8|nr:malto-oligosyltrehalose trehalohydrolase [Acidipropionibacterium thoenii]
MVSRDYQQIRVWAPGATTVDVILDGERLPMAKEAEQAPTTSTSGVPGQPDQDPHEAGRAQTPGWWTLPRSVRAGQRYAFSIDGGDPRPDPRSLLQPDGVHGPSEVFDPRAQSEGATHPAIDLRGKVQYELHIGTFTPEGTFDAAIGHLDELGALGVQAIEVMPVAQTPGHRNWGYDGVDLYATNADYGGPAGFIRFIGAAHARGIGVILDVVYNHLGPEGNYLAEFGPYFNPAHETPWGPAVNLDGEHAGPVRDFLIGNARQWLVDFGLDGLRLDAVHALLDDSDRHFLAELADAAAGWSAEIGRPLTLIAESDRNQPATVHPTGASPDAKGMAMQWADDVHHGLHAFLTGESQGYYVDFGTPEILAKALTRVFVHDGGWSTFRDATWGAPVDPHSPHYDGHSFVVFLQDHDQVGNRAAGDRIGHSTPPGAQAAGAALYLLSAFTPMIFMGEEWAASTPFPYFCDMGPELAPLVTEGRKREFAETGWAGDVPDPEDPQTFESAKLDWAERADQGHHRMLEWYRTLLRLRREIPELVDADLSDIRVEVVDDDTVVMIRGQVAVIASRADRVIEVDLAETLGSDVEVEGLEVLAAWDTAEADGPAVTFQGPGATVVRAR